MKDKSYISITVITFILIIITGCAGGSIDSRSISDIDVRKGLEGLAMDFTKNAPPVSVFEDSVFPVRVNLKNKGAFDIKSGFLAIGLEKAYIDFTVSNNELKNYAIEGRSIFNLNGDEEFITVNAKAKDVGAQSETHPSTIFATACYPYKTILEASVCVDTDIFATGLRDKSCEVKDLDFAGGQGAPVAITKIETRMLPDADQDPDIVIPHFIIHIENNGNGEVISLGKIREACTNKALDFTDFNRLQIRAFLSSDELNCNIGESSEITEIRLRDKKDIVRCTLDKGIESIRDAFTSPLRIDLEYGYTFTISKDITIEKILKY